MSNIKAIDSVGDPPLPIPNREVKPNSADGTAFSCGRVGHRHFFFRRALVNTKALFFCIYLIIYIRIMATAFVNAVVYAKKACTGLI